MLIQTLTRAAGRLSFNPGEQLDLPEVDALALINAGAAVQLPSNEPVVLADVEATKAKPKKG